MTQINLKHSEAWQYGPYLISHYGPNCYYCGCDLDAAQIHIDHKIPISLGGECCAANLVPACSHCNLSKGSKNIEDSRRLLVQKRIGWPKFSAAQIEWLRVSGFDCSAYDAAQLWFERHPKPVPIEPEMLFAPYFRAVNKS